MVGCLAGILPLLLVPIKAGRIFGRLRRELSAIEPRYLRLMPFVSALGAPVLTSPCGQIGVVPSVRVQAA